MKKLIRLLPLLLIPFLFTSCIDYVQSITYQDGKYQMYYKVTLSKLLFAMGDQDPEEIVNSIDEDAFEDFPENAEVKPVDTDLEVGAEFNFSIDPRTKDEKEQSFLPKVTGEKYLIPFLLGKEENAMIGSMDSEDSDSQAITEAILSSAKCRVLISKKIIPAIKEAYFEGCDSSDYFIPVYDYGESYCLEIPFILFFESDSYKFDKIVINKV